LRDNRADLDGNGTDAARLEPFVHALLVDRHRIHFLAPTAGGRFSRSDKRSLVKAERAGFDGGEFFDDSPMLACASSS
jgi:hypothetical protein